MSENLFSNTESNIVNELPLSQMVPRIPLLTNCFSAANDLTVFSSKDNLYPILKTSSQAISYKSKSPKSGISSNIDSIHSLQNNNKSIKRSKSNSSTNRIPTIKSKINEHLPSEDEKVNKSYDYIMKKKPKMENNLYFSLNNISSPESSPKSKDQNNESFLKSPRKTQREQNTIRRNLLIYTSKYKKRNPKQIQVFNICELSREKPFTNEQNRILEDLAFFEEGLNVKKIKINKNSSYNFFHKVGKNVLKPFFMAVFNKILDWRGFRLIISNWFFKSIIWKWSFLILLAILVFWLPIEMAFQTDEFPLLEFLLSESFLMINFWQELRNSKNDIFYSKVFYLLNILALLFLAIFLMNVLSFLKPIWCLGFLIIKAPEIQKRLIEVRLELKTNRHFEYYIEVFLIVLRIIGFANLIGCLWIYIGLHYKEQNLSWIINLPESYSNVALYFRSLTASLSNITLIGLGMTQGLIVPCNSIEYFFNCLVTMIGFLLLLYNSKSFLNLIGNKNEEKVLFEKVLHNYGLNNKEITLFSNESSSISKKNREQESFDNSIKVMSSEAREDLLMKIYWPFIQKIPVLTKNFSKAFLTKLLQKIEIVFIPPNEILFHERSYGNECLYFVIKGEVECFVGRNTKEKHNVRIKVVKNNEYLREFSFFSQQPDKFSAKSLTFTTAIRINLHDFSEILKDFDRDHENYASIKEKINSYNNLTPLFLKCEGCNGKHHYILDCPNLFTNTRKSFIFENFLSGYSRMERIVFQRKKRVGTLNALFHRKKVAYRMVHFQKSHQADLQAVDDLNQSSDNEEFYEASEAKEFNASKTIESKDSHQTSDNKLKDEDFIGNPPSIFLKSPTIISRKSLTESIFHENTERVDEDEDEEEEEEKRDEKERSVSDKELNKYKNTLAYLDEQVNDEESDEIELIKKKNVSSSSKVLSQPTQSKGTHFESEILTSQNNNSSSSLRKSKTQKGSKIYQSTGNDKTALSERDTWKLLQNFEKMLRSAKNNISSHTLTAQETLLSMLYNKKSFIGTLSNNKSGNSSIKKPFYPTKLSSSIHSSSENLRFGHKKSRFAEYLLKPIFAFDFDKPKEFHHFLPHNNLEKVIKKVEIDDLLRSSMQGNGKKAELKSKRMHNYDAF